MSAYLKIVSIAVLLFLPLGAHAEPAKRDAAYRLAGPPGGKKRVLRHETTLVLPPKELLARLKAGRYVTDTAILAAVAASANANTPLTPAGTLGRMHPAVTYRLIDTLLGLVSDRPGLAAELHRRKADLYDLTHDWVNTAREHAEALRLLTPLHVTVDTQRLDSLVQEASALYVLGERRQAEALYLEALSYDWYKITDPDALQAARSLYIRAGRGLIDCRRGSLAALKEIYFVPAANDELQPPLQRAIKEAEGAANHS